MRPEVIDLDLCLGNMVSSSSSIAQNGFTFARGIARGTYESEFHLNFVGR